MTTLHQCYRCGGPAGAHDGYNSEDKFLGYFIGCLDRECGLRTPWQDSEEEAAAVWNRPATPTDAMIEAVAKAIWQQSGNARSWQSIYELDSGQRCLRYARAAIAAMQSAQPPQSAGLVEADKLDEAISVAMRAVLDPGQFAPGYGSDYPSVNHWQREALRIAFTRECIDNVDEHFANLSPTMETEK